MNQTVQKILVVGGNGFIGAAVCKAAIARGAQVTSVSSSGQPYRTPKGHSPAWTSKVNWQKGDALQPQSFTHLLPQVDGVVHTLGTLIEDSSYKQALQQGNLLALFGSLYEVTYGDSNPLKKKQADGNLKSYEVMNRDSALRVCEAFLSAHDAFKETRNTPRPFVYISAEDIFRPIISARYIETKREAERGIEQMMADKTDYRGVYIRPSLVYHAHLRPLTTPIAAALDLSAALHRKLPPSIPTPASILRSLGSLKSLAPRPSSPENSSNGDSALESVANALTIPPIHVDHVADAVCVALDSRNDVSGVVDVRRMREVIGWMKSGVDQAGIEHGRS